MIEATFILLGIKNSLQGLLEWLRASGPLGLFGISLIDSAGIPLPGGPDAVMILLSANSPRLVPLYVLAATTGSAIGCTMLYLAARRAGVAALKRVKPSRRDRIENLLGRFDLIAIIAPAVLPPPFPFKPFVLCAGVFKLKTGRFMTAVLVGRAVRFSIEGWLAISFGEEAWRLIREHGWKVVIAVAILAAAGVTLRFFFSRSRRSREPASGKVPGDANTVDESSRA